MKENSDTNILVINLPKNFVIFTKKVRKREKDGHYMKRKENKREKAEREREGRGSKDERQSKRKESWRKKEKRRVR